MLSVGISAVSFQNLEARQYPNRGQILRPIMCIESSAGLSVGVTQIIGENADFESGITRITCEYCGRWFLLIYT
jgi:hypothetical protein